MVASDRGPTPVSVAGFSSSIPRFDAMDLLKPGMLGFVRPPAKVNHIVTGKATKALVIWAPGGEAHRIVDQWKKVQ